MTELNFDKNMEPGQIKNTVIFKKEMQYYDEINYRVRTIVPFAKNVEKNTYLFTRKELDDFLNDTRECGEYIISIRPERRNPTPKYGYLAQLIIDNIRSEKSTERAP